MGDWNAATGISVPGETWYYLVKDARMKLSVISLMLAASAVVWTGCQNPDGTPNNTASGALIGGAFGALTGAAIGGRHGGADALFGAAAGVVAGSLIGNAADQAQSAPVSYPAPATYVQVSQPQPLSLADVKSLVRSGLSDEVIISQLVTTHTGFRLSSTDIIDLRNSGVSDRLLNFMINTANDPNAVVSTAPPTVVVVDDRPPAPLVETVAAVPPAPGYVWIGGNWVWNGHWVWVGGHWSNPPRPAAVWVPGYWVRGPHGWFRTEGYWK